MVSQPQCHSDDGEEAEDLTSLITVFPNQGTLVPGGTAELFFKFSPRFRRSSLGWKSIEELAPRKDYALFINIEAVGVIKQSDKGTFKHGMVMHQHMKESICPCYKYLKMYQHLHKNFTNQNLPENVVFFDYLKKVESHTQK